MPQGWGRQVLSTKIVAQTELSVDGHPLWKVGGLTIDWTTVTAVATTPVTLNDGQVIPVGAKYLRYGTALAQISAGQTTTVTQSGGATGGTFTVTAGVDNDPTQTTAGVAYNATGATLQTAMRLLTNLGNDVAVTGSAGGPYTITYTGALLRRNVTTTVSVAGETGGTPAVAVANTETYDEYGAYGPADSGAADGRQTWAPGKFFLLNTTLMDPSSPFNLPNANNTIVGVIAGGTVWAARLNVGAGGQPTVAQILSNMPLLGLHYF